MNKLSLIVFILIALLTACKKEDEASPEDKQKAEDFKSYVVGKQFQLESYTSDKPIDYVEDDTEVKSETDLWPYVSLWIKDDFNVFDPASGKVTITQNAHEIETISDDVFTRDISIGADKNGVHFDFLNYQYNPLKYRLVEFTADHFTVYVDWTGGAKVYSRFKVLN